MSRSMENVVKFHNVANKCPCGGIGIHDSLRNYLLQVRLLSGTPSVNVMVSVAKWETQ